MDEPQFLSTLTFEEQPSALGFWLTGRGLGIYRLAASGGPNIFSDYQLYETDWIYGTGRSQLWFTLAFSSKGGELATEYQVQFGAQQLDTIQVWHRYERSHDANPRVNVHLVFDVDVTAPVPSDTVEEALALWGMELGRLDVSRVEVPDDPHEIATALWAPTPDLFVPTLTVVAGDEFTTGVGFARLGPPTSEHAFAAYSASNEDSSSENASRDRRILAHEIGHLAGLFHTSDLRAPDFLDDTPRCEPENLEEDRFSCPDANNIMSTTGRGSESTTEQRALVHNALFVAPTLRPGFIDGSIEVTPNEGDTAGLIIECDLEIGRR